MRRFTVSTSVAGRPVLYNTAARDKREAQRRADQWARDAEKRVDSRGLFAASRSAELAK